METASVGGGSAPHINSSRRGVALGPSIRLLASESDPVMSCLQFRGEQWVPRTQGTLHDDCSLGLESAAAGRRRRNIDVFSARP